MMRAPHTHRDRRARTEVARQKFRALVERMLCVHFGSERAASWTTDLINDMQADGLRVSLAIPPRRTPCSRANSTGC
jgi:hypothetical protein